MGSSAGPRAGRSGGSGADRRTVRRRHGAVLPLAVGVALVALVALASPLWLALPGTLLTVSDPAQPADAALVFEGTGPDAMDGAERWRQQGLVRQVVIVEAPIKTHALVVFWSELVARGIAQPSPTPADLLAVVRAPSRRASRQAAAALPVLRSLGTRSVLLPGGGLGARLDRREIARVFDPAGVSYRFVRFDPPDRDPARWYAYADDRRRVLGFWLQLLVPALSGDPQGADS